jgi:hypothetical protein
MVLNNSSQSSVATAATTARIWKACAEQDDTTRLDVQKDVIDRLVMICPRYHHYTSSPRRRRPPDDPLPPLLVLASPLRTYDDNLFHMLVMRNNRPEFAGRGRDLWCHLHAVTQFIVEETGGGAQSHIRWRLDYRNQTGHSNYMKELLALLASDDNDDDDDASVAEGKEDDGAGGRATTILSLRHSGWWPQRRIWQLLERRVPMLKTGPIVHSFHFRPNTLPNKALMDVADRVVQLVVQNKQKRRQRRPATVPPSTPFVLLVLRSGGSRRLAGRAMGTAAEIVRALLDQSLPVRVIDLAEASVYDQITWFHAATVAIGMHGAGLTNLVWMDHGRRRPRRTAAVTLIEIAASYGWGRYLEAATKDDDNGTMVCRRRMDVSPLYMKADFYNLARRFGVRHVLIHPVYSSVELQPNNNPIQKEVFYVDAPALAATAKLALQASVSSSSSSP